MIENSKTGIRKQYGKGRSMIISPPTYYTTWTIHPHLSFCSHPWVLKSLLLPSADCSAQQWWQWVSQITRNQSHQGHSSVWGFSNVS